MVSEWLDGHACTDPCFCYLMGTYDLHKLKVDQILIALLSHVNNAVSFFLSFFLSFLPPIIMWNHHDINCIQPWFVLAHIPSMRSEYLNKEKWMNSWTDQGASQLSCWLSLLPARISSYPTLNTTKWFVLHLYSWWLWCEAILRGTQQSLYW